MNRLFNLVVLVVTSVFVASQISANSLRSIDNPANQYERGILTNFPTGFGNGEFTFEIWVKLDNRAQYPVGACAAGGNTQLNWCSENNARYSFNCWWCNGNFLLDGVNFDGVGNGTFALQFYDGGRLRWLFADKGAMPALDGFWSIGNAPNANNPSLLDGQWHSIAVVRRFVATSASDLELWIDGVLIDTVRSNVRTNVGTYYAGYEDGYQQGNRYSGWFFMAEKQAVNIADFLLEDYKGLLDEVRFWNRAKTTAELSTQW
ncbi:MAG: LamG-like jellyroll fold domain-containing protein, partial [Casimicrobium sp.]